MRDSIACELVAIRRMHRADEAARAVAEAAAIESMTDLLGC